MLGAMDSNTKKARIYVRLLDEGTEVSRPTEALDLGGGLFKILPTADYSADDESWEFPPGSTVRVEKVKNDSGEYLRAVKA
jgi:hypothetical protein